MRLYILQSLDMQQDNYNINFDTKKLSSEDIKKHQDFDALLENYQRIPDPGTKTGRVRWLRIIGGAVAAAFIGVVAFLGLHKKQKTHAIAKTNMESHFDNQPFVNPPLKNVQSKFASIKVDANNGGIYEYENGSRLIVPKAAFRNDRGRLISGEVEIKYREFHDFVDFFLSGIPMEYDSAGTKYQLESAGMMEIYAEQNGERLELVPEKAIDIELVSNISIPKDGSKPNYNIYQLDKDKRNWVYKTVDDIEILETLADAQFTGEEELTPEEFKTKQLQNLKEKKISELAKIDASIPKVPKPLKPKRANENAITFEFDFGAFNNNRPSANNAEEQAIIDTKNDMDNLRNQWEGTIWQIKPGEESKLDNNTAKIIWDEEKSQLKQISDRDYELTLTNGIQTVKLLVNPVLSPEDYEKALLEFNRKFATYKKEMAKRESQLAQQKLALEEKLAQEKLLIDKEYEQRIAFYKSKGRNDQASDLMIRQKIVNRFKVRNFGIWNCDRPLPPYIHMLKGDFTDKHHQSLNNQTAYIVNKSQNTLSRFFARKGASVRFNSNYKNMMWLITKDNKLALFEPKQFEAIQKNKGKYTFVMDVKTADIESEEDLRKLLNFDE